MTPEKPKERKKLIKRLKNKYRLVLMNDATFDERYSASLTPLNVIAIIAGVTIVITTVVVSVIVFSPLKEYIPGYSDSRTRLNALHASLRADSLDQKQKLYKQYLDHLTAILQGEVPGDTTLASEMPDRVAYDNIDFSRSTADEQLRKQIESEERFALSSGAGFASESIGLPGIFFFTPIRGVVSASFNPSAGHLGVDVVAADGEPVKAVYDGTVLMASFTPEGGNVVYLQHPNNLVSVYKHNSVLLKKAGDQVKAGQTIAIMGNTGEFTDGPHLHFELWYDGSPLNPQDFIAFTL